MGAERRDFGWRAFLSGLGVRRSAFGARVRSSKTACWLLARSFRASGTSGFLERRTLKFEGPGRSGNPASLIGLFDWTVPVCRLVPNAEPRARALDRRLPSAGLRIADVGCVLQGCGRLVANAERRSLPVLAWRLELRYGPAAWLSEMAGSFRAPSPERPSPEPPSPEPRARRAPDDSRPPTADSDRDCDCRPPTADYRLSRSS